MADDIDDLLDEVETKFCTKGRSKEAHKKTHTTSTKPRSRAKLEDDIDDILAADEDIPVATPYLNSNIHAKSPTNHARPDSARKCFPIYIGGSACAMGMASSVNKRACDKLRCTSCDFRICQFENFEWHPDTDYLFLRNNVPDFDRLKSNLSSKKGSRAYCCQCSFRSMREIQELKDPKLKWVCGKH